MSNYASCVSYISDRKSILTNIHFHEIITVAAKKDELNIRNSFNGELIKIKKVKKLIKRNSFNKIKIEGNSPNEYFCFK